MQSIPFQFAILKYVAINLWHNSVVVISKIVNHNRNFFLTSHQRIILFNFALNSIYFSSNHKNMKKMKWIAVLLKHYKHWRSRAVNTTRARLLLDFLRLFGVLVFIIWFMFYEIRDLDLEKTFFSKRTRVSDKAVIWIFFSENRLFRVRDETVDTTSLMCTRYTPVSWNHCKVNALS